MDPSEEIIENQYTDPSQTASFSSVDKLYRTLKDKGISKGSIRRWLRKRDEHTLHHFVRRHFPRQRVIVGSIDYQWDADLVDMNAYTSDNDGYKYILVCIDILSHYLWTRPLRTKQGVDVKVAFQDIFQQSTNNRKPQKIRTDKGQEFRAKVLQRYFNAEGIDHFVTQNEVKANFAERVIKTLKMRIMRYFTLKQTHKWINVLQDFTDSYNHTFHRSIQMSPQSVDKSNEVEAWMNMYRPKEKTIVKEEKIASDKKKKRVFRSVFKFKVGDHVRISNLRDHFDKEYDERWTGEVFKVSKKYTKQSFPVYELEDIDGKFITGVFYQQELQKVTFDPDQSFKIEKVLKTRKRKGHPRESLVRWLRWPKKYDSWIPTSEISPLNH